MSIRTASGRTSFELSNPAFFPGYRGKTVDFARYSDHHRTSLAHFLNIADAMRRVSEMTDPLAFTTGEDASLVLPNNYLEILKQIAESN